MTTEQLTDICRLCLLSTKIKSLLTPITNDLKLKFEELTRTELPLHGHYPIKTCAECRDKVYNTYFFKQQLILKQSDLSQIIKEKFGTAANVPDEPVVEEWLEEHLEDGGSNRIVALEEPDSDLEIVDLDDQLTDSDLIAIPRVKNMQNPRDKGEIVKLIEDIEEKNQMILDLTAPHLTWRKPNRRPATFYKPEIRLGEPAPRKKNIVFKPPKPKLSLRQVLGEHVCFECKIGFPTVFDLLFHKETHQLKKPISCCQKFFMTLREYNRHRKDVHNLLYPCSQCTKRFLSRAVRDLHETTHEENSSDQKFRCMDCFKEFKSKQLLQNHYRTHTEKPFWCDQCPSSFNESYQLMLHRTNEHRIRFRCMKCSVMFKVKRQLISHMSHCLKESSKKKAAAKHEV